MPQLVAWADGLLAVLPPLLRIVLWAAFASAFSMGLYAVISPQSRMRGLRQRQKVARKALLAYDGNMDGLLPVILADLKLSAQHFGLTLFPFLVSAVPLVMLLVSLTFLYDYRLPAPGETVTVTAEPAGEALLWQPEQPTTPMETSWQIGWPEAASPIEAKDSAGNTVLHLPLSAGVPDIAPADWTDSLVPNPAGSLPAGSPLTRIALDLHPLEYQPYGPSWLRGFEAVFMIALLVFSLFIKKRFKIE